MVTRKTVTPSARRAVNEQYVTADDRWHFLVSGSQLSVLLSRISTGHVLECNDVAARVLGYDGPQDMVRRGRTLRHYARPRDRDAVIQQVSTGSAVRGLETKIVRTDGTHGWIAMDVRSLPGEDALETAFVDVSTERACREQLGFVISGLETMHKALHCRDAALADSFKQLTSVQQLRGHGGASNPGAAALPILRKLSECASPEQREYIRALESFLVEVSAPIAAALLREGRLTHREVEICLLVRQGLSTKGIADVLCVSPNTVRKHRELIRKRLGLTTEDVALSTYLASL